MRTSITALVLVFAAFFGAVGHELHASDQPIQDEIGTALVIERCEP